MLSFAMTRRAASQLIAGACLLLLIPISAAAQTSGVSGTVTDTSGAVLPGVAVEVASPALIERVRTATTDNSGRFTITTLRPGLYSITFTLPGFSTVRRENIELTSDFTATINADLRVGAVEETITVLAESPLVDVQSITTRTVMTREVMDAIPTGRNIQAIGIMVPGTSLAPGGGGALSRDVGGSGNLQQSPLQYRGSGDTVQTIEGLRLNNLCAQGAYSGVYWNDGSFQELSYVTGADSAEMGQGGMRVNMVPKDGGNTFRGSIVGNFANGDFASNNCNSPGVGQACAQTNLWGDLTFNPNNKLTNVSQIQDVWDFNPSVGGPIVRDKLWFNYTFRHWGVNSIKADSYADLDPSPFRYTADFTNPGIDDGHIVSNAARVAWQLSSKDKISYYHDNQRKYRDHWGIAANVPPEAAGVQVTPTSFVSVSKWTRTQTNRLLLEGGVGIYSQEYTELYQPSVTGLDDKVFDLNAIQNARVYTVSDQSTGKIANAWSAPADHFSTLRTYMGAASYVTGSHALRFGGSLTNGDWREIIAYSGDMQPITYNAGVPVSATLRLPVDRRNGIKADTGLFVQDRWAMGRVSWNLGLRYDSFIGETRESEVLPSRFNAGQAFGVCADGKNDPRAGCAGTVQNWKDISPRVGFALDVFGDGRTALKASFARYEAGQNIAVANAANPVTVLGLTDTRGWTNDVDRNGLPLDANGNIQFNELTASTQTATFGRNVSTTSYDPEVLNGWSKRPFNYEYSVAAQHQLGDRVSLNGGYYRRTFGNQTFTDDLRYDANSYDSFCINAPANPRLPYGSGGYPVCGIQDLKPAVFAQGLPANNLIRFSEDFGGETNMYQGFDVNLEARFANGGFIRGGLGATSRLFDNCNLLAAGVDAVVGLTAQGTEVYPDGTTGCHREYGFRPDSKILGSYTLPYDIQFSGTYQFSRGVQTGGAGPSIQANWAVINAVVNPALGRNWTGTTSKTIQLIREGLDYGEHNLHQLDLRASKRFRMNRYRFRVDFDLYNAFNSNWPYTVTSTFSTATSATWLRPTNALQARFFKIGAQFDF
jgi:hypothetical protein